MALKANEILNLIMISIVQVLYMCNLCLSAYIPDINQDHSKLILFRNANGPDLTTGSLTADARRSILRDLCPEISGREILSYRYFNETESCYETGEKGPCGDNMIFFGFGYTIYGKCDCNYNDFERILVFHQESKNCYFAFSQGFCQHREWIVFNQDWQPACEPNTCLKQQHNLKSDANNVSTDELASKVNSPPTYTTSSVPSSAELVPYKGRCVPLGETCQEIDVQSELHGKSQFRSSDRSTATALTKIDAGNKTNKNKRLPRGEIQFVKGRLMPQCIAHTWRNEDII